MSKENWSTVVGMPDESDKKNIQNLIDLYERTCPGDIAMHVAWERRMEEENAVAGTDPYLVKSKDSDLRKVLCIPAKLNAELTKAYPTMFRDRQHFAWFVRNFPMFRVAKKY